MQWAEQSDSLTQIAHRGWSWTARPMTRTCWHKSHVTSHIPRGVLMSATHINGYLLAIICVSVHPRIIDLFLSLTLLPQHSSRRAVGFHALVAIIAHSADVPPLVPAPAGRLTSLPQSPLPAHAAQGPATPQPCPPLSRSGPTAVKKPFGHSYLSPPPAAEVHVV